jgi:hypothetical protein
MRAFASGWPRRADELLVAVDEEAYASRRYAYHDTDMRRRVDQLLRDHEHGVVQQVGPGVIDFAAMRRELDLPK